MVRWDLAEATQLGSDQKIWSFLGLYWGIVADVDLESEVPLFMLGGGSRCCAISGKTPPAACMGVPSMHAPRAPLAMRCS